MRAARRCGRRRSRARRARRRCRRRRAGSPSPRCAERENWINGMRRGMVPCTGCSTSVIHPCSRPMPSAPNSCASGADSRTATHPTSCASRSSSHSPRAAPGEDSGEDRGEVVVVRAARVGVGEARVGGEIDVRRRARWRAPPTRRVRRRRGTPTPRRSRRGGSARRCRTGRRRSRDGSPARRTRPCPRTSTWAMVRSIDVLQRLPGTPRRRASSPRSSAVATPSAEKPSACPTTIAAESMRSAAGFDHLDVEVGSLRDGLADVADTPCPEPAPIVGANAGRWPHGPSTP